MRRIWLLPVLATLVITSTLSARQGALHLKDGTELWGDIDQNDPDSISIVIHNVRETMSRSDVASVEFFGSLDEEFQYRIKLLKPDDVNGRLEIARWADGIGQYELARSAAAEALVIDPSNPDAIEIMRTTGFQTGLMHNSATQPQPFHPTLVIPAPVTAPAVNKPYLTLDQVDEIRQLELKPDDTFKVSFRNDVKKRFLARGEMDATSFYSLGDDDQARRILATGDFNLANDVRINSDPASMVEFRSRIQPYLIGGCAISGCHNPITPVGGFALFVKDDSPQAAYTNFYMLQSYSRPAPAGGPATRVMIDRIHPDLSLLANYGLPKALAAPPHPPVRDFHPPFPARNDSRYGVLVYWMEFMLRPEGDDLPGIHYRPPWAPPATRPTTDSTGG